MKKSIGAKTIICPTPAWVVGTYDQAGKANIMTAAWACVCSSDPPSLCVCLRKARHTYAALMARKAFTVNVGSRSQVDEIDYAGMASGKNKDKFAKTGLTPIKAEFVDAPYVGEFPITVECSLTNFLEIGAHTLFVGKIMDVKVEESVMGPDGMPDPVKVDPVMFMPMTQNYFALGEEVGPAFSLGKKFM